MKLSAQKQGGGDNSHEHGEEEAEDVKEGVPLHQHKLSLQINIAHMRNCLNARVLIALWRTMMKRMTGT